MRKRRARLSQHSFYTCLLHWKHIENYIFENILKTIPKYQTQTKGKENISLSPPSPLLCLLFLCLSLYIFEISLNMPRIIKPRYSPDVWIISRARKRRPSQNQAAQMDECTAALVLMSLSSPRSPTFLNERKFSSIFLLLVFNPYFLFCS